MRNDLRVMVLGGSKRYLTRSTCVDINFMEKVSDNCLVVEQSNDNNTEIEYHVINKPTTC